MKKSTSIWMEDSVLRKLRVVSALEETTVSTLLEDIAEKYIAAHEKASGKIVLKGEKVAPAPEEKPAPVTAPAPAKDAKKQANPKPAAKAGK